MSRAHTAGGPSAVVPGLSAAPRERRRPPRHLADLDPAERRAAVAELGEPAFRAAQLSRHFFARYTDDAAEMTDLPAASREALAAGLLPPLLTADQELTCDNGTNGVNYWPATAGTHTVQAWVNDVDRFNESNLNNNKLTASITVP